MARRSIGIDITPSKIYAVQLQKRGHELHLERASCKTIGNENSSEEETAPEIITALKSLIEEGGFHGHVPVAVAVPDGAVLFQNMESDLPGLDHVRQVIGFELEDDFPLPAHELAIDICSSRKTANQRWALLVAAARKDALQERMKTLAEAGIECDVVGANVCALHAAITANYPEMAKERSVIVQAGERGTLIAIAQAGNLLTVRNVPPPLERPGDLQSNARTKELASTLVREVELTWRDAFAEPLSSSTRIVLGGETELAERLADVFRKELPCETTILDPFVRIRRSDEGEIGLAYTIAIGLALGAMGEKPPGMNFLAADRLKAKRTVGVRRALVLLGILLAAIAASWVVGLFLQLRRLENQNQAVRTEMNQIFLSALPEAKHIVNEEAQVQELEGRLKALRDEYNAFSSVGISGMTPLAVLQKISASVPRNLNAKISEMDIGGRLVQLKGTTDSFRSVDELRGHLLEVPEFAAVETGPVDMGRGESEVRFTFFITVKPGQ